MSLKRNRDNVTLLPSFGSFVEVSFVKVNTCRSLPSKSLALPPVIVAFIKLP